MSEKLVVNTYSPSGIPMYWEHKEFARQLKAAGCIIKSDGLVEYKSKTQSGMHRVGEYFFNLRQLHRMSQTPYFIQAYMEFIEQKILDSLNVKLFQIAIKGVANGSIEFPQLLSKEIGVPFIPTTKDKQGMLQVGAELGLYMRQRSAILIVEDVLNSGTSAKELFKLLNDLQPNVSLAMLYGVSRGNITNWNEFPFSIKKPERVFCMCEVRAPSYDPSKLPKHLHARRIIKYDSPEHPKNS